jgi:hypothetical protein
MVYAYSVWFKKKKKKSYSAEDHLEDECIDGDSKMFIDSVMDLFQNRASDSHL